MTALRILVVGKGGREHALCATLARCGADSGQTPVTLFCAPGSDAIAEIAQCIPAESVDQLVQWAVDHEIDLVVAGEEAWLVKDQGLADACVAAKIPCWGPCKAAAQLEASKAFAKNFLARHHIPTADFQIARNAEEARAAVAGQLPIVLKFDGLAAGKGVAVCQTEHECEEFIGQVFEANRFGQGELLVEEALSGPEVSVFAAVSGPHYRIIATARDYKRLGDNDFGPNTGGMGAVASLDLLPREMLAQIDERIVAPTVRGLEEDNLDYRGFLYFGLMLTPTGPQVIEYNVRFGDPECQAVMPTVRGDFARFLFDAARGELSGPAEPGSIFLTPGWSVALCAASAGYPESSRSGDEIRGLDRLPEGTQLFHAGTRRNPETQQWETAGGRVLAVVGQGEHLGAARVAAYEALACVDFDGIQTRSDVGVSGFEERS